MQTLRSADHHFHLLLALLCPNTELSPTVEILFVDAFQVNGPADNEILLTRQYAHVREQGEHSTCKLL